MTQPIRTAGLSPSPSPAPAARTRAAAGPQSRCNPPPFSRYGHRPAPRRPPPSPRLRSVPRPPSNTHRKPAGPCAQARPGQPRGRPPPAPLPRTAPNRRLPKPPQPASGPGAGRGGRGGASSEGSGGRRRFSACGRSRRQLPPLCPGLALSEPCPGLREPPHRHLGKGRKVVDAGRWLFMESSHSPRLALWPAASAGAWVLSTVAAGTVLVVACVSKSLKPC